MLSSDGQNFSRKQIIGENSIATPAIAAVNDRDISDFRRNMLYLSWTGTDDPHHLNLLSSQDGQTFSGKVILNTAAYQQQGVNPPHDLISPAGPALLTNYLRGQGDAGQGGGDPWLILAWTGYDGGRLWSTHFDRPNLGVGLASPVVHYTDTSGVAPALGQLGNDADYPFIAWAGTGNEQLNVALTSDLPSTG